MQANYITPEIRRKMIRMGMSSKDGRRALLLSTVKPIPAMIKALRENPTDENIRRTREILRTAERALGRALLRGPEPGSIYSGDAIFSGVFVLAELRKLDKAYRKAIRMRGPVPKKTS